MVSTPEHVYLLNFYKLFSNSLSFTFYQVLLDTFGDEIKIWLTFNEPYTFCEDGYGGIEAPGANSSGFEDYLCGHNVLRAHGMVYRMFDKEYRKKIGGMLIENIGWVLVAI